LAQAIWAQANLAQVEDPSSAATSLWLLLHSYDLRIRKLNIS